MESLQKSLQVQNLAITDLPPELIVNILSRLSVTSLCRFRCVSKLWLALINHPRFVKMHLAQTQREKLFMSAGENFFSSKTSLYSVDLESISYDVNKVDAVKIDIAAFLSDLDISAFKLHRLVKRQCVIGSSNGLLCFRLGKYFWLYNPSTRERKQVPDFNFPKNMDAGFGFGFSYVDSIDDYKIVILHRPGNIVDIYSLRKNSWTSIQHDFCIRYGIFRELGFPLNGVIHWDSYGYDLNPDTFDRVIIAFDLVEENFNTLNLPTALHCQFFGLFKGYLSFLDRNMDTYKLWVMKEYGVTASWTRILMVNSSCVLRPFCYLKNSNILMLNREYCRYYQELVFYNPKCQKFKKIEVNGCREFYVDSHIEYMESLVSLNYENHFRTEDKLLEYWF